MSSGKVTCHEIMVTPTVVHLNVHLYLHPR